MHENRHVVLKGQKHEVGWASDSLDLHRFPLRQSQIGFLSFTVLLPHFLPQLLTYRLEGREGACTISIEQ